MSSRYTANGQRRSSMVHGTRYHYCSCGRVVNGNGGKTSHRAKHEREQDGHRYIGKDRWLTDTDAGREQAAAWEQQRIDLQTAHEAREQELGR